MKMVQTSSLIGTQALGSLTVSTRISIQCPCLNASRRGYMNRHFEEPVCSLLTLEERSPIDNNAILFNMVTSAF